MKNWKKIAATIVSVSLIFTLSACQEKKEKKEQKSEEGVKITEEFTHKDPDKLEFETRTVLHIPEKSDFLKVLSQKISAEGKEGYLVIYGNGEKPVAFYEYIVFGDEKGAKAYQSFAEKENKKVEVKNTVAWSAKSEKSLGEEMKRYKEIGLFEKGTIEEYISFIQNTYFAEKVEKENEKAYE